MDMGINTPVNVELKGRTINIEIQGLDTVERALGNLQGRTPQALKTAVNKTARRARKLMIAAAKARYVVNAAGQRHLEDLKPTLFIKKMRNDLGYFENEPTAVYTGLAAKFRKGTVYKARVLADSPLKELPGKGNYSKAFLAKFASGHIGMVQRVIGSRSGNTVTMSGKPRWRNDQGNVEKLMTVGAPSAAAMHTQVWPEVQDEVRQYLIDNIRSRVEWIMDRYGGAT